MKAVFWARSLSLFAAVFLSCSLLGCGQSPEGAYLCDFEATVEANSSNSRALRSAVSARDEGLVLELFIREDGTWSMVWPGDVDTGTWVADGDGYSFRNASDMEARLHLVGETAVLHLPEDEPSLVFRRKGE